MASRWERSTVRAGIWDAEVDQHPAGWFWHLGGWLDYSVAFARGNADESFYLEVAGGDHVLCPLVWNEARQEFSANGDPLAAPLVFSEQPKARADLLRAALEEVEKMMVSRGARRVAFRWSPLATVPEPTPAEARAFSEAGYRDISWSTQVVDLTRPEADRWRDVRKSYKSLIHRGLRRHEMIVGDGHEMANAYEAIHYASGAAEAAPREIETYAIQAALAKVGVAFYAGVKRRGAPGDGARLAREGDGGGSSPPPSTIPHVQVTAGGFTHWSSGPKNLTFDPDCRGCWLDAAGPWVGFVYVLRYKNAAYYASGPSLAPNVMHGLLWRAMQECAARGNRQFELGWQGHPGADTKERAIEFLKRGFGGQVVPQVVWELRR